MRVVFLSLFIFLYAPLFAHDFLMLNSNSDINIIKKPSFILDNINHKQAYKRFKNEKFEPITSHIKSYSPNSTFLWISLEVVNNSDKKLFLSLLGDPIEKVVLYKYQNDKFIGEEKDAFNFNKANKYFENFVPKFYLDKSNESIVYLFKISSSNSIITELFIGTNSDILNHQLVEIIILAMFVGSFFSLFVYIGFLSFATKESDYSLYIVYMFFLLIWGISFHAYFAYVFQFSFEMAKDIKAGSSFAVSFFLVLFTFKFLNIMQQYRQLFYLMLALSLFSLVFAFLDEELEQLVILILITSLCLYLAISMHLNAYKPAKYYIFALSGFFIGIVIYFLMILELISLNFHILQVQVLGAIWEMIFLSLALGYKIRLLHSEQDETRLKNKLQEKILFLQSRYASVGQLVGNISHQWREPLSEIGAIQTNLHATFLSKGKVSGDKLLDSINKSSKILRHLSDTIDVFYCFFRHKKSDLEEFNIIEELFNIKKMVYYSLKIEKISLKVKYENKRILAYGSKSEFTNALINIILNAKDVLCERNILNPYILIEVEKNSTHIIINIEDNAGGIGLKPIEKVFESCSSDKEEHIGIGLFITKRIIEERMGGLISVGNCENGALFTIILPLNGKIIQSDNNLELDDIDETTLQRISRLEKEVSKQAEIEKTLRQWENIFNQTHWGVAVHKGNSDYFEITNPAFNTMYGYSPNEIKDLRIDDLFSSESIGILHKRRKEISEKSFDSFEAVHIRKDGSKFPVNIDWTIIKNENGDTLYQIANIKDITKEKISHNELLLKTFALNNIYESIFLVNKNAQFTYVNNKACDILGYSKEELLKLGPVEITLDWTNENWLKHWHALKKYKTITLETIIKKSDASILPVEISANYFEYDNKEYGFAFIKDITEQKAAQKEHILLDLALNNTDDATYIMIEQKIVQVNDGACKMLGYSRKELTSMYVLDLEPHATKKEIEMIESKMVENKIFRFERQHQTKQGKILDVEIISSFFDYDGITYAFATVRDISEQKKIKENLLLKEFALDKIDEAVYLLDMNTKFYYVNDRVVNALGYTKDELLSMTIKDIDIDFELKVWQEHWENVKKMGTCTLKRKHKRKDGTIIPTKINSSYIEYNGIGYKLSTSHYI